MTPISPNWSRSQHYLGPDTSSGAEQSNKFQFKTTQTLNKNSVGVLFVSHYAKNMFDNLLCKRLMV